MKKRILIIPLMFFCLHFCSYGQEKLILDPFGKTIAFECVSGNIKGVMFQPEVIELDSLGDVDTVSYESIAEINVSANEFVIVADSVTVVDPAGAVIALYDPVSKELKDTNGDLIFRLDEGGYILDDGDVIQGQIDESGHVYASDHNLLAIGADINPFKLAYFFFYTNK